MDGTATAVAPQSDDASMGGGGPCDGGGGGYVESFASTTAVGLPSRDEPSMRTVSAVEEAHNTSVCEKFATLTPTTSQHTVDLTG